MTAAAVQEPDDMGLLFLQNQADQLGLAGDAGVVEDFGQMAARGPHSNAEPVGRGLVCRRH